VKALDTDVLSEILAGAREYIARAAAIPSDELCTTVVTEEEILRGLLDEVRKAEAGQSRRTLDVAYERLRQTVEALGQWTVLSYSPSAEAQFRGWRAAKVPVKPHDLRIAAICVTRGATLITRNRRDFEQVPGLQTEFWT